MTDVAEVAVLRCLADGPGAPLALTVDIFFQYFVHFVLHVDLHALCSRRPVGVILCVLYHSFHGFRFQYCVHSVLEIVVVRPLGSTQSLVGRCVRVKVHATTALKEIHVFENEIDSCLSNHEELDNYWKFYI